MSGLRRLGSSLQRSVGLSGPGHLHQHVQLAKCELSWIRRDTPTTIPIRLFTVLTRFRSSLETAGSTSPKLDKAEPDTSELATTELDTVEPSNGPPPSSKLDLLPGHCPGCGAATQTVEPQEAGFYAIDQHRFARYFKALETQATTDEQQSPFPEAPNCQRCHDLLNHSQGVPIFHPSLRSIQAIIEESPHVKNHIYHVVDAADFPMSLIPNLQSALKLPRLRSQNRRSKTVNYLRGRIAEVSFIITRSDLLAPKKEQVDSLMPYLRSVLRDSLASTGRSVRLGNIRCVSAKRGWWTKEVKDDIWRRGGAGWMVGKVNVGKSNLYHVVFPKGQYTHQKLSDVDLETDHAEEVIATSPELDVLPEPQLPEDTTENDDDLSGISLLPPARRETSYPAMPLISSLPGTTASPIRIPFGNSRGELIDLPGIARSTLDTYVLPEHRDSLVMKSRPRPEQLTLKPGQSLLLGGGLLRITPRTEDLVFLAVPFVPLDVHVTSTQKAEEMQSGERDVKIKSIVDTGAVKDKMASAGVFELKWDVTRQRAGPLTDPRAAKLSTRQLPFTVWAADIVIEGVGWVEVVAQVRKRRQEHEMSDQERLADMFSGRKTAITATDAETSEPQYPSVEIFSPEKKFVALRQPLNAWVIGDKKPVAKWKRPTRPRRSMRSVRLSREAQAKG